MKRITIILFVISLGFNLFGQEKKEIYNPELDGEKQVAEAVQLAKESGRHVMVQIGGNWCGWCILFNKFVNEDAELKSFLDENYVLVHLNWSKENKNTKTLEKMGYPERFGFPVFVILDGEGQRIHTQNSALLEEGKGYDRKKVQDFFKNWTPKAIDPATYKK
jgi:thioredoxin-related protein